MNDELIKTIDKKFKQQTKALMLMLKIIGTQQTTIDILLKENAALKIQTQLLGEMFELKRRQDELHTL